jgi:hypothetical protein
MGKSRRSSTVQKPKQYTRLGESRVSQGVAKGTYIGGRDARVALMPTSEDD